MKLLSVHEGPSEAARHRDDIGTDKLRFSFHVVADGRVVDLAAPTETLYQYVQCLLRLLTGQYMDQRPACSSRPWRGAAAAARKYIT